MAACEILLHVLRPARDPCADGILRLVLFTTGTHEVYVRITVSELVLGDDAGFCVRVLGPVPPVMTQLLCCEPCVCREQVYHQEPFHTNI